MRTFYVTTPIYYVNADPHLGTAFSTIVADALARFHRARGEDVRFLTGTDEHGQKIQRAARERRKQPKPHVDEIVARFQAAWKKLDLSHDDFIRTTDERHKRVVADLWQRIDAAGDIYLGGYEGWYCVECENFYPEGQLETDGADKICPTHKKKVDWLEEPSFFFRMSKYQDALLEHFEKHPTFVQPEQYRSEVLSFIRTGLRDLSISRTTFDWGIPVPGQDGHVIYVWLDALTNYISALGGPGAPLYQRYWPANCHLIGKDILRFHAVYWPCFLLSAGLPLPQSIVVTGYWNVRGQKISKSIPATRVDPVALAEDIGLDALRYFLLREVPLGLDGDFTYESLVGRYNADLANDLGNLLHRVASMTARFCGGVVPPAGPVHPERSTGGAGAKSKEELGALAAEVAASAAANWERYAPSRALEDVWRLVRAANQFVDGAQPWKLAKDGDAAALGAVMHAALESVYWAAQLMSPALPHKAAEILARLGLGTAGGSALLRWPDGAFGTLLPAGLEVAQGEPLFPRIDEDRAAALYEKWMPSPPAAPAAPPPEPAHVTFEEFGKLQLRVAQITAAERVPKASRLLRLELDVGALGTRQVVAGIAERYAPEALVGKKVIFLANLKPATIRGVRSEGMVLAAGDESILGLSAVDTDVPPGTIIR